jgi:hypothetical protein
MGPSWEPAYNVDEKLPAAQNYFSQNIVDEQERHDENNSTENGNTSS